MANTESDKADNEINMQSGSCLCGNVHIEISTSHKEVGACHCSMCQIWAGGPSLSIEVKDDLRISGKDSIKVFNSSSWAERAFCGNCGTNLYYRLKPANSYYLCAGLFHNQNQPLSLHHQIYIDQKPDYYSFAQQTLEMTAAEVEAMFPDEVK